MNMRKSVWLAIQDDVTAQKLVDIARRHCKLVIEFGGKDTLPERRKAIQAEIERLRAERNYILASFEQEERP